MSQVRANSITNAAGTGAPDFPNGLTAAEKVGVGTATPSYNLVVSNGGAEGLEVDPIGVDQQVRLLSYDRVAAGYTSLNVLAAEHIWSIGSVPKLRMNASGALGVNGASYGTAGQVITSAGSAASPTWANAKVDPDYTSAEFGTAAAGRYTFAHGLGVLPNRIDILMRLTAAVGGWAANTYFVCDGNNMFYDGANPGVVTGYDATNIYTQIGSDFRFLSTAGVRTGIPFASAVFRVRAWK